MKSLKTILIVGILLFSLSAAGTWFLIVNQSTPNPEEVAEAEPAAETELPSLGVPDSEKVDAMPVAMRPETPVTIEAVTELAQSIMQKEKKLFDSQQRLNKEEKRIDLLFEDLKRERDELAAFGERIDSKIAQAREATELLKLETEALLKQTQALSAIEKKTGKTTDTLEDDELDRRVAVVKNWFKNLEPEQAANYLKEFADRGDIEFAAKLLDSLEDRQTAKVLAAFDDAPLVAQIVDSITNKEAPSTFR